jgi:hypothetical protein
MLDFTEISRDMETNLQDYTEIPQILEVGQALSPGHLLDRIVYNFSKHYQPDPTGMIVEKELVSSPEISFENDIEYSYITHPEVTLNITAYGETDINPYITKAHDWFKVPKLGGRFFEKYNVVIIDVTEIENLDTNPSSGYRYKRSFDVILRFEEVIKVREKTIEIVKITDFDNK